MNAGTSSIRTSVASTRTATVNLKPISRITDTSAAINAAKEIIMISAAAVITRAVSPSRAQRFRRWRPSRDATSASTP